jgi:hypothetical protein
LSLFTYSSKKDCPELPPIENAKVWLESVTNACKTAYPGDGSIDVLAEKQATAATVTEKLSQQYREVILLGHGPDPRPSILSWIYNMDRVRLPLASEGPESENSRDRCGLAVDTIGRLNMAGTGCCWTVACEVTHGPAVPGEGIIGLARALHLAGCQATLASQFHVRPVPTQRIFPRANRYVWEGHKTPSQAIQEVQRDILRGDRGNGSHPYYWAAWIMIGDSDFGAAPHDGRH